VPPWLLPPPWRGPVIEDRGLGGGSRFHRLRAGSRRLAGRTEGRGSTEVWCSVDARGEAMRAARALRKREMSWRLRRAAMVWARSRPALAWSRPQRLVRDGARWSVLLASESAVHAGITGNHSWLRAIPKVQGRILLPEVLLVLSSAVNWWRGGYWLPLDKGDWHTANLWVLSHRSASCPHTWSGCRRVSVFLSEDLFEGTDVLRKIEVHAKILLVD
jgi:hypothetical protein